MSWTAITLSLHKIVMRMLVSMILLGASLFVILSGRYDSNATHWAFLTVGTVMGFWLRGTR